MSRRGLLACIGLLLLALAACDADLDDEEYPTPEPIPQGAEQVHTEITLHGPGGDYSMDLDRYEVPAGEVYLVVRDGAYFVERQTSPDASAGPLTIQQKAQISEGEGRWLQDTRITQIVGGSCDPREDPPSMGMPDTPFCQQLRVTLQPGQYILMAWLDRDAPIAVLAVTQESTSQECELRPIEDPDSTADTTCGDRVMVDGRSYFLGAGGWLDEDGLRLEEVGPVIYPAVAGMDPMAYSLEGIDPSRILVLRNLPTAGVSSAYSVLWGRGNSTDYCYYADLWDSSRPGICRRSNFGTPSPVPSPRD